MFAAPGILYVYPIHGKYCMNAVTEEAGTGAAVLIRAIEPIWGLQQMRAARGYTDIRRLTRGPAMLCQALKVDRAHDGIDLIRDRNFRLAGMVDGDKDIIDASPRIGISKSKDLPLRFTQRDSHFLSR